MLVSPRLVSPRLGHVGRRNGRALEQWDTWKGTCYLLRTSVVLRVARSVLRVAPECRQFYRRRYPTRLTLDLRGRQRCCTALCLDYIRRWAERRCKGSCIRDELHWNYLFSNKNCARVVRVIWNCFRSTRRLVRCIVSISAIRYVPRYICEPRRL